MEISLLNNNVGSEELLQILTGTLGLMFNTGSQTLQFELHGFGDARQSGKNCIVFAPQMNFEEVERRLESCFVLTESPQVCASARNIYCVVADARAVFIDLLNVLIAKVGLRSFASQLNLPPGVSPAATIAATAVIEDDVSIEEGAIISAGCVIKAGTQIGRNTIIRENTIVGTEGIILYKSKDGRVMRFPHVCGVSIGSDSEVGAGCVVSRGILTSTVIGSHVVIGNLCNIGHGVCVADNVWMSVGCLIGGHTHIAAKATLGMGAHVRDNLMIGEGVAIGMGSVVVKDIESGLSVFGNPAKRMAMLSTGPKR